MALLNRLRDRNGNAVVEVALILPLLLLVAFGITEFGRAWMTLNVMATASREGARLAAVTLPDIPLVEARATEVLAAAGITPSAITVTGPDPLDTTRRVTVAIDVDFTVIPGEILGTFSGTIPLHSETVMRHESF